jgi:dihydrolipoamide dehydrogenase
MVVGELTESCGVVVVGGGPGGYVAAIRLAQLGQDVLLVEQEARLGGVCLNEGCIPSKALIHGTDFVQEAREAARMGVDLGPVSVDLPRMVAWKDGIVARLTGGIDQLMKKNGVRVLQGRGVFASSRRLAVSTAHGPVYVDFERAVIATGSCARPLPGLPFDGRRVIGSREALSLDRVPGRLVVVGGGSVGLELACVYAKLGADVTVLEAAADVVAHQDADVRQALKGRLKELGVTLHAGVRVEGLDDGPQAVVQATASDGSPLRLPADVVLAVTGRIPNTADLGLERVGVRLDARGFIAVNERQETSAPGLYAIGDVAGPPLLAHKAYREAKVAAQVIAGEPAAFDNVVVPAVIYTDPEVAWAGLTEDEARSRGHEVKVGRFPFRASGRALTLNAPVGFVKAVADAPTGRLLGVTIVGRDAGELISEAALAIEMGAFLDDLAATIHPHPSLSEALLESVEAALGEAVHVARG